MQFKTRKRNRKKGFDYSSEQIYFVTICTHNKTHDFGFAKGKCVMLNEFGEIANQRIQWLEEQYLYVDIHNFVVVPNHVHVLFEIDVRNEMESMKIKSVSELMGAYKTTTSKMIHSTGNMAFQWKRSFHNHIVRDTDRYENIYHYISKNPSRWHNDIHNNENPAYI